MLYLQLLEHVLKNMEHGWRRKLDREGTRSIKNPLTRTPFKNILQAIAIVTTTAHCIYYVKQQN